MHRIDTKTAQKDKFGAGKNGFTRGNPQTGTPATDLDDDYFDMLQEELCSVVEASGASLEKGRNDQLLTALRALLLSRKNPFGDIKSDGTVQTALENLQLRESFSGVVGQSRNARMLVAAASVTATFSADELIVEDGDGRQYRLSNFNKSVDLMNTGAGGMDTGTVPETGFVALYAIYNPTTYMSSLLAVNATTAGLPEIYGGSALPHGYTASALVSVWGISKSKFKTGMQHGRVINTDRQIAITTTAKINNLTELSIASIVPKNARKVSGYGSIYATSGDEKSGGLIIDVASTSSGVGRVSIGGYVGNYGIGVYGQFTELLLSTPQSIFYDVNPDGTSITEFSASLFISGYTI
ncbi:Uncharacterised protein [Escherichia coli]|nr:hypothetical protein AC51_2426 [Escherichia coli 5-172-05_S3_C3]STJ72495.1 Uncharacterised protein [Escherichia coli]